MLFPVVNRPNINHELAVNFDTKQMIVYFKIIPLFFGEYHSYLKSPQINVIRVEKR